MCDAGRRTPRREMPQPPQTFSADTQGSNSLH